MPNQEPKENEEKPKNENAAGSSDNNKSTDDPAADIIAGLAVLSLGSAALYGICKGLKKIFSKSKEDEDKDIEDYASSYRPSRTYNSSSYSRSSNEYSSTT